MACPCEGEVVADLTAKPSIAWNQRQPWLVFVVLIVAHAAFNLFLNPIGAGAENVSEGLALPLMGATIAQPVLFAIWAAAGVFRPRRASAYRAVFWIGTGGEAGGWL